MSLNGDKLNAKQHKMGNETAWRAILYFIIKVKEISVRVENYGIQRYDLPSTNAVRTDF